MKQDIQIDENWLKGEYELWKGECFDLSFSEWLYEDFKHGPTVGAILGVNGFITPENKDNAEEFFAMNEQEQAEELAFRFDVFYEKASKALGITKEEMVNDLNF